MKTNYDFYTNDTNVGGRIHPRNWMYRVALWVASFDENRLKYNPILIPLIHEGRCCLRVDAIALKKDFPEIYNCVVYIIRFLDAKKLN